MGADVRLECVGELLGRCGDPVPEPEFAVEVDPGVERDPPVRAVEPLTDRNQRGSGPGGQQRRSGGHPGRLAEEGHRYPGGGEVPVGEQAHHAARPQPLGEHLGRAAVTALERQHLHPEPFAVVHEPLVERFGLQALGDGRERHPLTDQPDRADVPVPDVREGEDDAASVGPGVVEDLLALHRDPRDHPGLVHHRQPERLEPVPRIGLHAAADQVVVGRLVDVRSDHPAQVGREAAYSGTATAEGDVGGHPEAAFGQPSREHLHRPPPGGVGQVLQPSPHAVIHLRSTHSADPAPADVLLVCLLCRHTSIRRCATVTAVAATSSHNAIA
jgi:hypothetical protein